MRTFFFGPKLQTFTIYRIPIHRDSLRVFLRLLKLICI